MHGIPSTPCQLKCTRTNAQAYDFALFPLVYKPVVGSGVARVLEVGAVHAGGPATRRHD
jgi:hypothetical protein